MAKSGLLLTLITTAALTSACEPYALPCPAIAQATVVSVTVAREYVPRIGMLHLKACQEGRCEAADVALLPGTAPADQGCAPEGACSATASPDGTMVGMLMLASLTEAPMALTATGTSPDGSALPARTLDFRPRGSYPFGEQCGRVITASLRLDAGGLRQSQAS